MTVPLFAPLLCVVPKRAVALPDATMASTRCAGLAVPMPTLPDSTIRLPVPSGSRVMSLLLLVRLLILFVFISLMRGLLPPCQPYCYRNQHRHQCAPYRSLTLFAHQ